MTIRAEYYDYLERLGRTVTVAELNADRSSGSMVALRHDVDHDLDLALEMSFREQERGCRATYFLLHTAAYWSDPRFIDKVLQIQDFGHEVGLHVNLLTQWYRGQIDDVDAALATLLREFREAGVRVRGVSAHGDRCCYETQFINYWCFSELVPDDPTRDESGRTAEGIRAVPPGRDHGGRIDYPPSGRLTRPDRRSFEFWSVSLREHGLDYDAWHVPRDLYFSDSGGRWTLTPDPCDVTIHGHRVMVLMHPIYYRGPGKIYFFFSSARCGSKWLANFVDAATPARAQHEFALNHRYRSGELTKQHRTGSHFIDLAEDHALARELLVEMRNWLEDQPGDYAEANVYLERFKDEFDEVFADAVKVHLQRDPKDIVRSIFNRNWYDTPEDNRHPRFAVEGWDQLSPFEKCCWYVRLTHESLVRWCHHRLKFESMVTDINWLTDQLGALDIPVYPRLAAAVHGQVVNANAQNDFPPFEDWSPHRKAVFHRICGPISEAMGYSLPLDAAAGAEGRDTHVAATERHRGETPPREPAVAEPTTIFETKFRVLAAVRYRHKHCRIQPTADGIEVIPDGQFHAHVLFAGRGWRRLSRFLPGGWKPSSATYYRATIDAEVSKDGAADLYRLTYDANGTLMNQRKLGTIRSSDGAQSFAFNVLGDVSRFTVALYIPRDSNTQRVRLRWFRLEAVPMRPPL